MGCTGDVRRARLDVGNWVVGRFGARMPSRAASRQGCQGLITDTPAAMKGPVSREATVKPWAAATAAM